AVAEHRAHRTIGSDQAGRARRARHDQQPHPRVHPHQSIHQFDGDLGTAAAARAPAVMNKKDAEEAAPLMRRSLDALVTAVPAQGRVGWDLRVACSVLSANAEALLQADAAGPPLANCFDLAWLNGATQKQLAFVRNQTLAEAPALLGGVMLKNAIVDLCLTT